MIRRAALLVAALSVCASTTRAQIYTWRDEHGVLILSDHRRDPNATTVSAGRSVRTTGAPVPAPARYDRLIERQATAHGVRADLVRAVIHVESGFNPRAVSPKGAVGLMQLMPDTAAALEVADPFDPAENIRGGVAYLRQLLTRYGDDEELALAAYNAGPGAVMQHGNRVPPYRETRQFVGRVERRTGLARATDTTIYLSYEVRHGRRIRRYSNIRPADGEFEIAARPR